MPFEGRVVVVGASAGGLEPLLLLARGLRADLPAAVFVVLHLSPSYRSYLAEIMERASTLPVRQAVDGEEYREGHIYVAPPDHHLLIDDRRIHLSSGPRENRHRPAIDPLFRSAAESHGSRAISVLLSGSSADGAVGTELIARAGGVTIVQDPDEALHPRMPQAAIVQGPVDHILKEKDIPGLINSLAEPAAADPGDPPAAPPVPVQTDAEELDRPASGITCPDCGGALWEVAEAGGAYRCRIGHRYGLDALAEGKGLAVEEALWAAVRSLEEQSVLNRKLAGRASAAGRTLVAEQLHREADTCEERAHDIRQVLALPRNYESHEAR